MQDRCDHHRGLLGPHVPDRLAPGGRADPERGPDPVRRVEQVVPVPDPAAAELRNGRARLQDQVKREGGPTRLLEGRIIRLVPTGASHATSDGPGVTPAALRRFYGWFRIRGFFI